MLADHLSNLLGAADAQRHGQGYVEEDKESIGFPPMAKDPLKLIH